MREQRKRMDGVVTSDKMDKTVMVAVTTTKRHRLYGKVILQRCDDRGAVRPYW